MAAGGHFGSPIPPKTKGYQLAIDNVLSMAMPNMKLIGEFITELENPQAFWAFLYKMAARGHFVFPIDAKNHRVLVIWDLNGYGEYEFDWCIGEKVMACTSVGVRRRRRRRGRRRRNQKHSITEIFKFRRYNYVYFNLLRVSAVNIISRIVIHTQESPYPHTGSHLGCEFRP